MKQIDNVFQVDNRDIIAVRDSETGQIICRGHWHEDHMLQCFNMDGDLLDGFTAYIEEAEA